MSDQGDEAVEDFANAILGLIGAFQKHHLDDGYPTFAIRVPAETGLRLESLLKRSSYTKNGTVEVPMEPQADGRLRYIKISGIRIEWTLPKVRAAPSGEVRPSY